MSYSDYLEEHRFVFDNLVEGELTQIDLASDLVANAFVNGGKVYLCGSGPAKALADYASFLFMNRCFMERPPLPAISLSSDIFHIMYSETDEIYDNQLSALLTDEDIVIGFASDKDCTAVINALRVAAYNGSKSIGFSGVDEVGMRGVCDIFLSVESDNPLIIREVHMFMLHALCSSIDKKLFSPEGGIFSNEGS